MSQSNIVFLPSVPGPSLAEDQSPCRAPGAPHLRNLQTVSADWMQLLRRAPIPPHSGTHSPADPSCQPFQTAVWYRVGRLHPPGTSGGVFPSGASPADRSYTKRTNRSSFVFDNRQQDLSIENKKIVYVQVYKIIKSE